MKIQIYGENIEVTNPLEEHIKSKFNHIVSFDSLQKIEVRIKNQKKENEANVNLHYKGHDVHITSKDVDMYNAINKLADKTQREIMKLKEKHSLHISS